MKSNLKHLEVLVTQQSKDFQQLCEHLGQLNMPSVLAQLKQLTSIALTPKHVKDSASQTSPPLAQRLSFTRQDKYTSEKPVMWQVQALPAACSLSVGSPRPREFVVWGEGSKRDALQEEAVQPAVGTGKRNRQITDRAVQTSCQNSVTKTGSENCGSPLLGHKVPEARDPVSQGDSQLISRGYKDLNNSATSIKNTSQKWQAKGVFSCDPCEQRLVTEQKGITVERGKKSKQQQPRKAPRRRSLRRKQEQMPSKTCVSNSKYPRPPVSSSQRSPWGQQETLAQPLQLQGPGSPTNLVCSAQGGTVMPSKNTRADQGNLMHRSGHSTQDNSLLPPSSQGDHQMSWFSDLNDLNPRIVSPQSQESGKNILYDLGFDSSDDGFWPAHDDFGWWFLVLLERQITEHLGWLMAEFSKPVWNLQGQRLGLDGAVVGVSGGLGSRSGILGTGHSPWQSIRDKCILIHGTEMCEEGVRRAGAAAREWGISRRVLGLIEELPSIENIH